MDAATVVYASAAVLLVIAGMAKVVRPATTAALLDDLGVPVLGAIDRTRMTYALGCFEVGLGVLALVSEVNAVAAIVGVTYVVFAGAVVQAMRIGAGSCGCFGRVDAPPSWWHVGGNLVLGVASLLAVSARTPLEVMDGQPLAGAGFVVLVGVLAGLEVIVFTAVPEALASRR